MNGNGKTDIIEILRYAPQGIKLYMDGYGYFTFKEVKNEKIIVSSITGCDAYFYRYGNFFENEHECLLYPNDSQTWDEWQKELFRNGDIIVKRKKASFYWKEGATYGTLHFNKKTQRLLLELAPSLEGFRYANPEERERFWENITQNGYEYKDRSFVFNKEKE